MAKFRRFLPKSKTVKNKKKILKNFNPVEFVVQKFEIDEKLASQCHNLLNLRPNTSHRNQLYNFASKMKLYHAKV
jgi:hypothetical protein